MRRKLGKLFYNVPTIGEVAEYKLEILFLTTKNNDRAKRKF